MDDVLRLPELTARCAHKTLTSCERWPAPQILVPLLYLALVTTAGCFVAGLVMLSTLASDELRDVLSGTLADVGECISGCAGGMECNLSQQTADGTANSGQLYACIRYM